MYTEIGYSIYLALTIITTVWVAHTLSKNGHIFLVDSFGGNEPLAKSVNALLVVGFYLINLGFVGLAIKNAHPISSVKEVFE
jgi:hypothetical protein